MRTKRQRGVLISVRGQFVRWTGGHVVSSQRGLGGKRKQLRFLFHRTRIPSAAFELAPPTHPTIQKLTALKLTNGFVSVLRFNIFNSQTRRGLPSTLYFTEVEGVRRHVACSTSFPIASHAPYTVSYIYFAAGPASPSHRGCAAMFVHERRTVVCINSRSRPRDSVDQPQIRSSVRPSLVVGHSTCTDQVTHESCTRALTHSLSYSLP